MRAIERSATFPRTLQQSLACLESRTLVHKSRVEIGKINLSGAQMTLSMH